MKRFLIILVLLCSAFLLFSCGKKASLDNVEPYAVQIDGTLYLCYERTKSQNPDESQMMGKITSKVGADQLPTLNDSSNFLDVGQPYAKIDGHFWAYAQDGFWYLCEPTGGK
ncbi:MAG: hypothetical protein GXW99_11345 [Clostridiales bacterium]|nr:hypothetical protein [Clostridiales bacterium]